MIDLKHFNPTKARWLTKFSNIPTRFLGVEFSDLQVSTPIDIELWIDQVLDSQVIKKAGNLTTSGKGLLFDGGPGIGKTSFAVIAAEEVIYRLPDDLDAIASLFGYEGEFIRSRPIYYLTYPEFLTKKKATFDASGNEKYMLMQEIEGFHGRATDDSYNVRILILDDLGKEYGSAYDNAAFDEVLRARYDRALPTIVTTNVLLENWEAVYRSAMASFANEAFYRVPIIGIDQRGAKQ